ncbi:MAG: hypothetical protein J7L54_03415 [Elusimicrobia bacterium]|nr:hypothetical protein [Elusimicrobiota bacterium]
MDFQPNLKKIARNFFILALAIFVILFAFKVRIDPERFKLFSFLIFLLATSVLLFFWGWEIYGIRSIIAGTPTSKIRSIPMGLVEIKGKARQKFPIQSPINKINCVFYKYKIERYVINYSSRGQRGRWIVASQGTSVTPFIVEDSTGSVLIEPSFVNPILKRRYHYSEGPVSGGRRYSEWYIMPGENVYILGFAGKSREVFIERKEKLLSKLREIKSSREKQKKFDLNKDGVIDEYEWELAVRSIKQEIQRGENLNDLGDVSVSGTRKEKMIISDGSEEKILKKLGLAQVRQNSKKILVI